MKTFRTLFFAAGLLQVSHASDDFVKGMKGLQQAAKDPELMAQLMKDLNDPEMMAEAKKMMENPEWKKEMRKLEEGDEATSTIKHVQEMMNDLETFDNNLEEKMGNEDSSLNANKAVQKAFDLLNGLNDEQIRAIMDEMETDEFKQMEENLRHNANVQAFLQSAEDTFDSQQNKEVLAKVQDTMQKMQEN